MRSTLVFDIDFGLLPAVACLTLKIVFDDFNFIAYMFYDPFYISALVISGERLKKYVFHKILTELPEGPFCIVYIHTTVQTEDNSPGLTILRWIYEEFPNDYKDRLNVVYFIHPGLRSRILFATLGRFLLSGG